MQAVMTAVITRIPAEFLGRGRSFRNRIINADDQAVRTMTRVFSPLARRAERSSVPRRELLQGAARHWRQQMPADGFLDSNIQLSRRELHIREVRLGGGTSCQPAWNEGVTEPVIAIMLIDLHVAPEICRLMTDPAALVCQHALGRWYQRALNTSDAALVSDLSRLAASYDQILTTYQTTGDPRFLCPANDGQWAGSVTKRLSAATGRHETILNVRTFLPEGSKDRAAA
jgi:hypothetical protein